MEILAFEVEGERYGLPLASVREVTRAVSPTPLPGGPDLVEGLVNVRGTMNVLLDVRRRFGHPGRPIHPDDHFVLARVHRRDVVLHVDRAIELIDVPEQNLGDVAAVTPEAGDLFGGVARLHDGLLLIHDLAAFLTEAEELKLDEALSASLVGRGEDDQTVAR